MDSTKPGCIVTLLLRYEEMRMATIYGFGLDEEPQCTLYPRVSKIILLFYITLTLIIY